MARRPKNAIEKRLDYLSGCWQQFAANPDARLLRWLTDEDGARMLDLFFAVQNEEVSDLPDVFVRLLAPFEPAVDYGFRLAQEFQRQYEESREQLAADGIDNTWRQPGLPPRCSDIDAFLLNAVSFQQHYGNTMSLLAFILTPETVADPEGWQSWLQRCLSRLPKSVRLTCVDRLESPLLESLAGAARDLVTTVTPRLEMHQAVLQIASELPGGGGPGFEFRKLFLEISQLAPAGNMAEIRPKAEAAMQIARKEQWPALETVIHVLMAAVHFQSGRGAEAAECYRAAARTAGLAQQKGDPTGAKLLMQARLGEAAALLNQQKYGEAAQVYQATAPIAEQVEEPLMKLECWRMAGYCHQQDGKFEWGWQSLWRALEAAQQLDETARRQSTLPYVGRALLELTRMPAYRAYTHTVHNRMAELMGEGWEQETTVV